jgi:DNA mismatch repair protein MutL
VATLVELLGDLAETDASRAVGDRVDHMLATVACHSVVRAGDLLSVAEAEALLASMDEVDHRAHCPHGRPVLLRVGVAEIARRFGRT